MGYESKIYVVRKTQVVDNGKRYAQVLAMFDIGKCYDLSDVLRTQPATECYIYADDGNTHIIEDRYGKPLTEIFVNDLLNLIYKNIGTHSKYLHLAPLKATLETIHTNYNTSDIVCLHYGY